MKKLLLLLLTGVVAATLLAPPLVYAAVVNGVVQVDDIADFTQGEDKIDLDDPNPVIRLLNRLGPDPLRRDAKELDLVSPVANSDMTIRYRSVEKPRSVMGVMPAYSPMNDFHAGTGRFITDNDLTSAARSARASSAARCATRCCRWSR